jgi:hypothetical protein
MLITRFGIKVKIVLRLKCKPDRILARRRKDEHNKRKQDSSGAESPHYFHLQCGTAESHALVHGADKLKTLGIDPLEESRVGRAIPVWLRAPINEF